MGDNRKPYTNAEVLCLTSLDDMKVSIIEQIKAMSAQDAIKWLKEPAPDVPCWKIFVKYNYEWRGKKYSKAYMTVPVVALHKKKRFLEGEISNFMVFPVCKTLRRSELPHIGETVFLTQEECAKVIERHGL